MSERELRAFQVFLRVIGSVSLLAVVAVVMPREWMAGSHEWLGLGELPEGPIVGYLARSTSAFYAILGGLMWVLSMDLRRYRTVVCYVGGALVFLGAALLGVDIYEGMPGYWMVVEGPADTVFGVVIWWWGRRL